MAEVKRIKATLTTAMVEGLDRLVEVGNYMNRQDAMRAAVRHFLFYNKIWLFSPPFVSEQ